ncbi:MAG: hypothetical protein LBU26_06030 [Synergistaceae bacterium]|jgi:PTS system trehalose-specific IIC component|nr:hypothetical protein [Synergistaceae bacterium]
MHRGNAREEQISIPATISCYLGVTEPAMFGINLQYIYPFAAAMIGSALAGLASRLTGVVANSIGVGGIPGILVIQSQYWLQFALCMGIAIAIPFALTVMFGKFSILSKKTA